MLNRRRFLTHSCGLGMAGATLSSSLLQLGLARAVAAQDAGDYRALVCILLAGGNDSYNMLVPDDADQYQEYASIRSDLALPRQDLLSLSATTAAGRRYGLHPGMSALQSLFNAGDAAMLCNVGTLVEPFDAAAVESGAPLPLGLFSHADQIQQWQTSIPDVRSAQGWGGRIADLLQGGDPANGISMSISLSGSNVFQSGASSSEYAVSAEGDGAIGLNGYDNGTPEGDFRKSIVDALLAVNHEHILRREYSGRLEAAVQAQQVFTAALATVPPFATPFSPGPFSQSLRQIARIIAAREELQATRQTFFITVGGWDHHDDVLDNQAAMLPGIADGLLEFRNALVEIGMLQQVTTFTISDFGRTLTSNGKGSDHGWGGHHIVMGGGVQGGQFYGDYPLIQPASPLDMGRGRYAPTTAVDQYFAELALWFGVSPGKLSTVLPNIGRFYDTAAGQAPVGFMSTS
jgi:uncharacterized protein (DUF1501 family)